ncbi:(d)CMP kinase [Ancylomarina sp. 16SWW S1-10-2]|uniref:(d)CMP kinase n=1 Tax=Ancylomarina sp. 16SWW S1-10-2 TaxID=2499681 RepID=UPI0012AD25C1|nr:(d)CMP kinase [Ancylomarina sp. 16SWW S1-10-2]MRT91548.1 (d)CMP kinase [Ancylomarina sp. 16SWW S1-10-2]
MNTTQRKLIIAIDGHSSCGKSTMAKDLAKKINYTYIDSGAMYRVITLFAMRHNLIKDDKLDESKLAHLIDGINITFSYNDELERHETFMNGELVEDEIRSLDVSNNVSLIATIKFVREKMVALQRKLSEAGAVIMDGRDIGTVVFPNADLKIFMTADVEVRAARRFKELKEKGDDVSLDAIRENVQKRDFIDENRDESPLQKADDAIVLNNSYLTKEEQLEWIVTKMAEIQ